MRKWNFCAGPAVMPEEVLKEAKEELLEWNKSGMSIMEMSHRSKEYDSVANEAKNDLKELLKVPNSHEILFLQGGATLQFSMIPLNFSGQNSSADYVLSGSWSKKAVSEASKISNIEIISSSEKERFTYIEDHSNWKISSESKYVHYVANETIQGVCLHEEPEIDKPLVCDMSSCILSGPIDVSKYSLIYAGAQKNIGPAGLTIVIIKKDMFEEENTDLPNILRYSKIAENNSMLNTPPTFAWYLSGKVFKWLKKNGGLSSIKIINDKKANLLYDYIDSSDFYSNPVRKNNRSIMNVPFTLSDASLDQVFLEEAEENNFLNLKGHRSVGGMRASIYNAMPIKGINELIKFMKFFEKNHG